jgi:hypothetical protein
MKQTAVEWLVEQISYTTTKSEIISYHKDISKLVEQAKEMEKEDMHAEYMRGWRNGVTKQGLPAPPLDRKIYK